MADDEQNEPTEFQLAKRARWVATRAKRQKLAEARRRRRELVYSLKLAGCSDREVAKAPEFQKLCADSGIGATNFVCWKDWHAALAEDKTRSHATRDHFTQVWLLRYEKALRSIWPGVLAGDRFAVENFIKLGERASKLLGLDAPLRIVASVNQWKPLEAALDSLTSEELLLLRRLQSTRVLGPAVDDTPNVHVLDAVKVVE